MKTNYLAIIAFLLFLLSIGYIIYEKCNQKEPCFPNYTAVYYSGDSSSIILERNKIDTLEFDKKIGGKRIKDKIAKEMVKRFRQFNINDSTTKYVDYSYDSLLKYMTYIAVKVKTKDSLGVRVYFAKQEVINSNGKSMYMTTPLFYPITFATYAHPALNYAVDITKVKKGQNRRLLRADPTDENFFDQGNICPVCTGSDDEDNIFINQ